VKLTGVAWPDKGDQILTARLDKVGTDPVPVTVSLIQGTSLVIATQTYQPGTSFVSETITLSDAQKALITDYTDLHVRVTAGSPVASCCPAALPTTLYVTFTGGDTCPCATGSFPLVWDGISQWIGTGPLGPTCGHPVTVTIHCMGGSSCSRLVLGASWPDGCDSASTSNVSPSSCSCSPLSLTYDGIAVSANCGCPNLAVQHIVVTQ
jgi:hypothetical protein